MGTDRFAEKSVVVTGAGNGIGLRYAEAFAAEGASVTIAGYFETYRRRSATEVPLPRPASPGPGDVRPSGTRDRGEDHQVPGGLALAVAGRPSPTAGGSKDVHYRFEAVTVPVSDVDRAKDFYQRLGWRLDADLHFEDGGRAVQVTPPGSACSVHFGTGGTSATPGSAQGLELVVDDIDAARAELAGHGAQVSEVFHTDGAKRVPGPDPEHRSYLSLASFSDPDGNGWLLQEVTTRLPGRTTSPLAAYGSVSALADAMRRAAEAHSRHEKEIGHSDPDWPDWYAQYMADEVARRNANA